MSEQKNNQKLEASLKQLSSKQRAEVEKEAREARQWKRYGIITAIILVLVAALLFWDAGFVQRSAAALKVGSKSYSAVDLDYYFYTEYNGVSTYASYYGLDTSKSLKEQTTYSGQTWYDYLCDEAKEQATQVGILSQEAKEEGYTISEDGQKNIDDMMDSLTDAAKSNNVSEKYYLSRVFGRHMTPAVFKRNVEEYFYAMDYQESKTEGFEVSDEDIQKYYDENKSTLDTYDFECYSIDAEAESTTDADGNTVEPTDAENAAAAEKAKKLAEKLEKAIKSGDSKQVEKLISENGLTDMSDLSSQSFQYYSFNDWLTDEGRKAGDITISEETREETIEDEDTDTADSSAEVDTADSAEASTSTSAESEPATRTIITNYYVLKFNKRYIDNYYGANIRTLTVSANTVETEDENAETTYDYDTAKAKAEELEKQFVAAGANEDAFNALDTAHDEEGEEAEDADEVDASSSAAGEDAETEHYHNELQENIKKGSLSDELEAWVYGKEQRKAGDYTIIKDEANHCYKLVYFVGWSDVYYWQTVAQDSIRSDKYDDWYDEAGEKYTVSTTWLYAQVG